MKHTTTTPPTFFGLLISIILTLCIGCVDSTSPLTAEESSSLEESSEQVVSSQEEPSSAESEEPSSEIDDSSNAIDDSSEASNPEPQSSEVEPTSSSSELVSSSSHTERTPDDGPMVILTYLDITEGEEYTDTTYGFGRWSPEASGSTDISLLVQSEGYYSAIYTVKNDEAVELSLTAVTDEQSDTLNSYSGFVYGYTKKTGYSLVKDAAITVTFDDDYILEIEIDAQGRYSILNKKNITQIVGIKKSGGEMYGGISQVSSAYIDLQLNKEPLFTVNEAQVYMYPVEAYTGTLKATYDSPASLSMEGNIEWDVTASADGLINDDWAFLYHNYTFSQTPTITEGWCVAIEDYKPLLKKKLKEIGLSTQEVLNLTTMWNPLIETYATESFVTFYFNDLSEINTLTASPAAETTLRYLIGVTQSSDKMDIPEPNTQSTDRNGFTIVEAGIYFHDE
ncbi:MAG: hypothetical protein OCC49_00605 [Fibrobacterales bacterium]